MRRRLRELFAVEEDEGAKTEEEERGVDWPLEARDRTVEVAHPGAEKGDGS